MRGLTEEMTRRCVYCGKTPVGLFLTKPGSTYVHEPLCFEHSGKSWTSAQPSRPRWGWELTMQTETVHALIAEKGGEPFGLYFTTGEGKFYPNGEEECSGNVVAKDGREYTFWTGWRDGGVVLDAWSEIAPCDGDVTETFAHVEYQAARKAAGL